MEHVWPPASIQLQLFSTSRATRESQDIDIFIEAAVTSQNFIALTMHWLLTPWSEHTIGD